MSVKDIVQEGWNKIGKTYHENRIKDKINQELQKFVDLLPEKAKVLDAGSGSGVPASKFLDDAGLEVIGIDISDTMLELSRKNVPGAKFIKKDILNLDFKTESFDGIVSVFTLFHIPKEKHESVFQNFYRVLKKGAIMLINTGISESEGVSNFFGVPMYWSNNPPRKTLKSVKNVGFSIIFEGILIRGGEYQYWIFAKKE